MVILERSRVLLSTNLRTLARGRAGQATMLWVSMIVSMALAFVGSIVAARLLGPERFGDVKFVQTVFALLSMLVTVGYLQSGSRLVLLEDDPEKEREAIGFVVLLSAAMGGAVAATAVAVASPVDDFFRTHVARVLVTVAPFFVVAPMKDAVSLVLQSANRVGMFSLLTVGPPLVYLVALGLCFALGQRDPTAVLLAQEVALIICLIPIVAALKPKVCSLRRWWEAAGSENRRFGWPVYVGSLAGVASGQVNRLAIAYWLNSTAVGYYGLAMNLTEPLKLIPAAVATSSFREFARVSRVPRKVLALTMMATGASLVLAVVSFGLGLELVYSRGFASVGPMAQVAAFGAVLYGFGDLFNRFLGAHGEGPTLRNAAFAVGGVNAVGFFVLVPPWGAWGAVATAVAAGVVYLLFMLASYQRRPVGPAATVRVPQRGLPSPHSPTLEPCKGVGPDESVQ